MIKRLILVLVVALLLIPSVAVHADAIIVNQFYGKHRGEIEVVYGDRLFIIDSPSGYVFPKEEPGSEKVVPTGWGYQGRGGQEVITSRDGMYVFENGDLVHIMGTYHQDRRYWGIMRTSHMYQPSGWIPMDEVLVIYHSVDFNNENAGAFYAYTGSYDAILSAKKLVLWQRPGSDREKIIYDNEEYIQGYTNASRAYKDEDGREWGQFGLSWVCLSDPENSKIPAFTQLRNQQNGHRVKFLSGYLANTKNHRPTERCRLSH